MEGDASFSEGSSGHMAPEKCGRLGSLWEGAQTFAFHGGSFWKSWVCTEVERESWGLFISRTLLSPSWGTNHPRKADANFR